MSKKSELSGVEKALLRAAIDSIEKQLDIIDNATDVPTLKYTDKIYSMLEQMRKDWKVN